MEQFNVKRHELRGMQRARVERRFQGTRRHSCTVSDRKLHGRGGQHASAETSSAAHLVQRQDTRYLSLSSRMTRCRRAKQRYSANRGGQDQSRECCREGSSGRRGV